MKKLLSVFLMLPLLLGLFACAANDQASLVYQYGTLKMIERGDVTAGQVIAAVDRVRAHAQPGLQFGAFTDKIKEAVGYGQLMPSDRLLVDALIGDTELDLGLKFDSLIDEGLRAAINSRLDAIQQAAALYGG